MEALGSVLLVGGLQHIGGHNIGFFEGGLILRNIRWVVRLNTLIGIINILGDDVTYDVVILTEHAICLGRIGRTVFVSALSRIIRLILLMRCTVDIRVPGVPLTGVVDGVGQHVARIVADIVGRTEHFFESNILFLSDVID